MQQKNNAAAKDIQLEKLYLPEASQRVLGVSPNKQKGRTYAMLAIYYVPTLCTPAFFARKWWRNGK